MTTDLPHKEQLDLILENSEDMVMIDDGVSRFMDYVANNNIDVKTITMDMLSEFPKEILPNIIYVSSSYINFGFEDNPVGKK